MFIAYVLFILLNVLYMYMHRLVWFVIVYLRDTYTAVLGPLVSQ